MSDFGLALVLAAYMEGTSQDVKRLKKSGIFTFYTLRFLDHLHLCCFEENYYVF